MGMSDSNSAATPTAAQPKALRILAKSVFRELKSSGYQRTEILAFATEMLSLVGTELRDEAALPAE